MGRPTKCTPETQTAIVQALNVGATHKLACKYAGISEECLYSWMRQGAEGKEPYLEFMQAVKRAEGRAAVGWLAQIEAAAKDGTWQAAAWKLERRYPEEYGRQIMEQHHSGSLEVHETLLADALKRAEELRHANGHSSAHHA